MTSILHWCQVDVAERFISLLHQYYLSLSKANRFEMSTANKDLGNFECSTKQHIRAVRNDKDVSENTAVCGFISAVQESSKPVFQETESEDSCHQKLNQQSTDVSIETISDNKQLTDIKSDCSSPAVPQKAKAWLYGFLDNEVQSPYKRKEKLFEQEKSNTTENIFEDTANTIVNRSASMTQESEPSQKKQHRFIQLKSLQNSPLQDTPTSVDAEGRDGQLPETILKALWEKKNNFYKIISIREEPSNKDNIKIVTEASHCLQTDFDADNINHIVSPQGELTKDTEVTQERNLAPQTGCCLLADFSKKDGTYRAKPVMIDEETDESLTDSLIGSQKFEPQENVAPFSSSVAFNNQGHDDDIQVLFPTLSTRVISAGGQRPDFIETSDKDAPKSNVVLKLLKVAVKGFVNQKESQKISDESENVQARYSEFQVKTEIEAQESGPSSTPPKDQHPKSIAQDGEFRKSPTKTCHPRVLPRESSNPKEFGMKGSPLKTFPINIDPQTKLSELHREKPTPMRNKSPTKEPKQTVLLETQSSSGIPSQPGPLYQEAQKKDFSHVNSLSSSPESPQNTEKLELENISHLTRSSIPDYQHYLGPQEKAFFPSFHQRKAVITENEVEHRPRNALAAFVRSQSDSPTKRKSPKIFTLMQNKDGNSSNDRWTSNLTFSISKQMKTSMSLPVLQDETDSDSTNNLDWRRSMGSSTSNLSVSSGMASISSVNDSISSIYLEDGNGIEAQGSIQFALNYIQRLGELHIFVVDCRDLAMADTKKKRSDPYVKCYLLPDKTRLGKRKTSVKKSSNPTYNEILRFKVTMEILKTQSLNVSVWHNDTFGHNSFLGEVNMDMSGWNFGTAQIHEYALKARISAQTSTSCPCHLEDNRGQMRVALRFLPQTSHNKTMTKMETGEVQIWVKDCKNLPAGRGVIIDPFVKCTVLPDTSQKSRQKTRVVKRTANPMFNHTMVYDGFQPEDLRETCVEVTVWDHDRLNSHYIGGLRLGLGTGKSYGVEVAWMDSTTREATLWQRMLQSDGEWVEDALPLRMLVIAKSLSKTKPESGCCPSE
ncbi:uncharacterized protein V6R79_016365 [Siganus canaliculatus]